MNWTELDTWIVLTAALMAMACALPGVFLLLNRQSMLGDAISHGVLPGLAIAFLATGSRTPTGSARNSAISAFKRATTAPARTNRLRPWMSLACMRVWYRWQAATTRRARPQSTGMRCVGGT